MIVKATREGLIGHRTATGHIVDLVTPHVALPCVAALWRWVKVTNPDNGLSKVARVLDVGPWEEQDAAYVYGGERPSAESGADSRGRKTNGAGIDLGEVVWRALKLRDNQNVDWQFVDDPGLWTFVDPDPTKG